MELHEHGLLYLLIMSYICTYFARNLLFVSFEVLTYKYPDYPLHTMYLQAELTLIMQKSLLELHDHALLCLLQNI
jgi:hypothetical protein